MVWWYQNQIDYVTIASTGNATDFGDLTVGRGRLAATSNKDTYAVFIGGYNSNVIDYVTMASTGNASDWGDCDVNLQHAGALSNNHGGL